MSGAMTVQDSLGETWQATGTDGGANLQQVAADRLAAHRRRRAAALAQEAELETRTRQHREAVHLAKREDQRRGAGLVRDAVKARYQQRESYREFLAVEAERAISQAQAEADVAARRARAVAESQMALLEELDELTRPETGPREEALASRQAETRGELAHALADIVMGARELIAEPTPLTVMETRAAAPRVQVAEPATREVSAAGITVRLFEDMPTSSLQPAEITPRRGSRPVREFADALALEEAADTLTALDEEIDFRRAPEFPEAMLVEAQPIHGNLIEFPRELIAPRRARPRLIEGSGTQAEEPQLRIFEVDAEQPDLFTSSFEPKEIPEWQTLQLGGFEALPAASSTASDAQTHLSLPVYSASLERRLMAAAVDLCCAAVAWLAAAACAVQVAGEGLRGIPRPLLALTAILTLAIFALGYQVLFFTFAEATPGMRYARIALCTFGDGNPSRRAMRRRIVSSVFAACPLGLGFAWALLDNDKLGWHDRMSRMYQRAY